MFYIPIAVQFVYGSCMFSKAPIDLCHSLTLSFPVVSLDFQYQIHQKSVDQWSTSFLVLSSCPMPDTISSSTTLVWCVAAKQNTVHSFSISHQVCCCARALAPPFFWESILLACYLGYSCNYSSKDPLLIIQHNCYLQLRSRSGL